MVIQQLPDHLRLSVCIFYLVLRGLDTVEDDMTAFAGRQEEKLAHLRSFYRYLRNPQWVMNGVGEGDEAILLQNFNHVNVVFGTLGAGEQEVISDICRRMGEGMASFAGRDLREGTVDTADYNLYCHYVAGLVGEGLSRLFVARGDEAPNVATNLKLADDMGLFLQKTNIIRDYLEDLVEGRAFWPREIWSQYAPALANLRAKVDAVVGATGPVSEDARAQEDQARACLNHLIADALTLAPSCLRYMESLRNPEIFRFCAIPQVMAIATLDKLTNNADVFTGVVKIRKGQALLLMNQATSMHNLYSVFLKHTRSIRAAIPPHHKVAYATAAKAVAEVEAICCAKMDVTSTAWASLFSPSAVVLVLAAFLFLIRHLYFRSRSGAWGSNALPRITDSADVAVLTATVACVMYLFACAGVPVVLRMGAPTPSPSSPTHKALSGGKGDMSGPAAASGAGELLEPAHADTSSAVRRANRSRE